MWDASDQRIGVARVCGGKPAVEEHAGRRVEQLDFERQRMGEMTAGVKRNQQMARDAAAEFDRAYVGRLIGDIERSMAGGFAAGTRPAIEGAEMMRPEHGFHQAERQQQQAYGNRHRLVRRPM